MRRFHLNVNQLKIIAIVAMTIDHIAAVFLPEGALKIVLRCIGRLAAPIMCYMIAEGYHHTSNRKHYLLRLLIFDLLARIRLFVRLLRVVVPCRAGAERQQHYRRQQHRPKPFQHNRKYIG